MSDYPKDDLFEDTKMTFGQHLEELRVALFRSIIGIVVGFLIGLCVSTYVVRFIQSPLQDALTEFQKDAAVIKFKEQYNYVPPDLLARVREGYIPQFVQVEPRSIVAAIKQADPTNSLDWTPMTDRFKPDNILLSELPEFAERLRKNGMGVKANASNSLWKRMDSAEQAMIETIATSNKAEAKQAGQVAKMLNRIADDETLRTEPGFDSALDDQELFDDLVEKIESNKSAGISRRLNSLLIAAAFDDYVTPPELDLVDLTLWEKKQAVVQSLGPQEAFMIWLKAGFITGLILSSPWVFWQIWMFVAAGLYPHEKNYVYIYLPFSLVLFLAGAALAFFFVFKPVLNFLFWYNQQMNIAPDMRISDWISFVLYVPLGFGLAFQLPLVMLFINRLGLVTIDFYTSNWRISILVIAIVSMVLTPADPISMLLMAVPLTCLYFLGIALCKWMPKGRNPFAMEEVYEP